MTDLTPAEDAWLNRLADAAEAEGREGAVSLNEMRAVIERLEADPVGLAEYQAEAREWAELDVTINEEEK